jgi:hypothetical protein
MLLLYLAAWSATRKQFGYFRPATGRSLGLLSFTFVKLSTGRGREISPLIWVLSVLFLLRHAFLGSE